MFSQCLTQVIKNWCILKITVLNVFKQVDTVDQIYNNLPHCVLRLTVVQLMVV